MKLDDIVQNTLSRYKMIGEGERVLVGFSGGADSVCLLSVLHKFGIDVTAAHLNHNMRDTAARDMEFCAEFCRERGIPFVCKTAAKGELKSENSARTARYDFFYGIMSEQGIDLLATAHNKNDSAETVLLHMLRGAATDGLCGIAPKEGRLIRPLIFVKKPDIIAYCNSSGLEYMTDETNLTDIYSRNKLRNKVIPALAQEFNPSLVDCIADNARITAQDSDYLKSAAEAEYKQIGGEEGVGLDGFLALHPAILSRVVQLMWRKSGGGSQNLSRTYVEAVKKLAETGKSGSRTDLPNGMCARVDYSRLTIVKRSEPVSFCLCIEPEQWYELPEAGLRLIVSAQGGGQRICLDGGETLTVRSRRAGDSFAPCGMKGTKKLSDYMIDEKIPLPVRDKIPLLCVNGEIAAVVGKRTSSRFLTGQMAYYIRTENII